MLERDYELIKQSLESINTRHSLEQEDNPYQDIGKIQRRCTHMWPNDTDAIFVGSKGKRKCAICGKEF